MTRCDRITSLVLTDDSVWMSDEAEREEYVLNETGLIWAGTSWDKFTWHWNFAQVSNEMSVWQGSVCRTVV